MKRCIAKFETNSRYLPIGIGAVIVHSVCTILFNFIISLVSPGHDGSLKLLNSSSQKKPCILLQVFVSYREKKISMIKCSIELNYLMYRIKLLMELTVEKLLFH